MQQILVAVNQFNDAHIENLRAVVDGWANIEQIDQGVDHITYTKALERCNIVVGWPPADCLVKSDLKLVQLCSAGYDPYLGRGLHKKPGLVVCNARGVFSAPAAEQTLAMMFALTRQLNRHIRDQANHVWRRAAEYRTVEGDTMCVVGLGSIGNAIAERCAGVGMKVIGVTRTGIESVHPPVSHIVAFNRLHEVLPQADHVALSLPATDQTVGMFDEAMFRRMKRGSCFFNVGRGSLVVEADLLKVLEEGHLWGAGLDVFETEPLPAEHPFWDMPNIIVVPHTAGRDRYEFDRLCDLFMDNLQRYHRNEPLNNVIDLGKKQ